MKRITSTQLQREFGLSFKTAELIIQVQTTLMRKHCAGWYSLAWGGVAVVIASNILPGQPAANTPCRWLLPVMCLCTLIPEMLAQCRARTSILAAAHAAATRAG